PGQSRDHRRVGAERDRIAGRERAAEIRHGEVLVEDPPALERDVVDRLPLLDADREGNEARCVGELLAQPLELARIAVGDLVVDGDPRAPRRARSATAPTPAIPPSRAGETIVVRERNTRGTSLVTAWTTAP